MCRADGVKVYDRASIILCMGDVFGHNLTVPVVEVPGYT